MAVLVLITLWDRRADGFARRGHSGGRCPEPHRFGPACTRCGL